MKLYDSSQQSFYDSAVLSSKRAWSADVGTASAETYPGCLKSFTLKECMSDGKNIVMGNTICKQLTVNLINVPAEQKTHFYESAEIDIFLNLYDYLGSSNSCKIVTSHFYLDKPKFVKATNGNYSISITAYDKMYQMSKVFDFGSSAFYCMDAVEHIANKYGLEVDWSSFDADYEISPLNEEVTDRVMLGYIAGLLGKSAYINDDNQIAFKWYTEYSTPVTSKYIYQGSDITEESESRTIKMLESGTQSNVIVYPSSALGYSINFENPFITDDIIQGIYDSKIAGDAVKYTVGKLKFKGDPLMNAGSIVTVTDREGISRTFYVMQRTLSYDGGLYDTLECHGESESTITYRNISPTEKRINRALSKMEEAIKNATDIITQTQGSIFEVIPVNADDPTQGNSGWKLYSGIGMNYILANSSGIGFSSNGGESFDAAAIYIDENGKGHINANEVSIDNLDISGSISVGVSDVEGLEALLEEMNTDISTALSDAETANSVIGEWCYDNDTTIIDGGKIATGTIDADKIKANSITVDKLLIGDLNNLSTINPDSHNPYNAKVMTYKAENGDGCKYFYQGDPSTAGYYTINLANIGKNATLKKD